MGKSFLSVVVVDTYEEKLNCVRISSEFTCNGIIEALQKQHPDISKVFMHELDATITKDKIELMDPGSGFFIYARPRNDIKGMKIFGAKAIKLVEDFIGITAMKSVIESFNKWDTSDKLVMSFEGAA